jgi:hypothetical protein|tara:strand:+ start:153 stop:419 length:267 start_codon:yes stop_codon:yes gene_type:complete
MEESKGQQTLDLGESTYSGGPILFENIRIPNITMTSLSPPPGLALDKPTLQLKQQLQLLCALKNPLSNIKPHPVNKFKRKAGFFQEYY